MQLVEQGKIKLNESFLTYLPGYTIENKFDKPVTVADLLTHKSGLENREIQAEDMLPDNLGKTFSMDDYAREHMPPVVREPGTAYMYDNFGYLLLGLIVEKVSGVPFETYMDEKVFGPLGMDNSGFLLEGALKDNLATGYTAAGEPVPLYGLKPTVLPEGGMLTTAEDVGKFMNAFLNGGAAGSSRILSKDTVTSMEQYRSYIHPLLPDTTYGFEAPFQIPGAGASSKIVTKAGDMTDFSSYMFLIPEQNTGVFLTYNKQGPLRNLFYPQFIQTFFPQYAAPADLKDYKPQSSEELSRFAGYYADIRSKVLVSGINDDESDLTQQFTAFKLDGDGKVLYMKEPYLNPLGYAQKGVEASGYADVDKNHPYAKYIFMLQSLGYLPNDALQVNFHSEEGVTRGQFVQDVLSMSGVQDQQFETYAFNDIKDHPAAPYIQVAAMMGMVKGDGKGSFKPDQVISREEAAAMIQRVFVLQYPKVSFNDVKLSGKTNPWAVPAVQMMVALGIYGPEVTKAADGTVDFHSKEVLNKGEEAAILYSLMLQPTDLIVASMQQNGVKTLVKDAA
jgi:CubicO group peptidase (beta-lactamase class C family)